MQPSLIGIIVGNGAVLVLIALIALIAKWLKRAYKDVPFGLRMCMGLCAVALFCLLVVGLGYLGDYLIGFFHFQPLG